MDWRKKLKQMYLDHVKATAPGFFEMSGRDRLKVKPYTDKNRNGLIRCVIDWINYSGGTAKKTNKGSFIKVRDKMVWMNARGKMPTCDILGVYKSKAIEISVVGCSEAKYEEIAGGWRLVINSFTSFLEWWQERVIKSNEISQ